MRIFPYPTTVEEEGVEVCRRLRAAGLHVEADWVEEMVEGVDAIKQEANVVKAVNWELEGESRFDQDWIERLEEKVQSLEKSLKALRGG